MLPGDIIYCKTFFVWSLGRWFTNDVLTIIHVFPKDKNSPKFLGKKILSVLHYDKVIVYNDDILKYFSPIKTTRRHRRRK